MELFTKRENRVPLGLGVTAALLAVASLPTLLCFSADVTHSMLMTALFGLLAVAGARFFLCRDRRLKTFAFLFGWAFALCQLMGWRLDAADTVGGAFGWLLLASIGCAPAAAFCFAAFERFLRRFDGEEQKQRYSSKTVFWAALGLIALCWLPYYLAYFPGMFNYDSAGEASQFLSGSYDGAFPPFHTMLLAGFYSLGQAAHSPNAGIALYTAVQCLALAASMAYSVAYLHSLKRAGAMVVKAALLFALLPFHPLLAMSTTKDIFFSAALLTLMIQLHKGWQEPERWKTGRQWAGVTLLCGGVCLLRPNGAAAVAVLIIVGFFLLGKGESRRRFLAITLCGLALYGGVNVGLNAVLKPSRVGIRELLSVPLSQVARVYTKAAEKGETLSQEDEILTFIPDANRYQRHLADPIKRHTTVGVSNMPAFLSLWGRLGKENPAAYVDAWAYLTKGYWHLDDATHLDIYAERGDHGYMETKNQDGYGVTRASLWPQAMETLDQLFVENEYCRIPVFATLMEPALWCWLLAAVGWIAIYRKNKGVLFCSVMLGGVALTLAFGACGYMRYAYPMALCTPFVLGLCLAPKEGAVNG
ncbi:MAG: DUF6020 family protein [Eubacteriales bacterium]|nr:DUF6020 family protein [Eubacteriales bacterium]